MNHRQPTEEAELSAVRRLWTPRTDGDFIVLYIFMAIGIVFVAFAGMSTWLHIWGEYLQPYSPWLAVASFLLCCVTARHGRPSDVAWALFTIGWYVMLAGIVYHCRGMFSFIVRGGTGPRPSDLWSYLHPHLLHTTVPLLMLSAVAAFRARRVSRGMESWARTWLILGMVLGTVSLAAAIPLTLLIYSDWDYG